MPAVIIWMDISTLFYCTSTRNALARGCYLRVKDLLVEISVSFSFEHISANVFPGTNLCTSNMCTDIILASADKNEYDRRPISRKFVYLYTNV